MSNKEIRIKNHTIALWMGMYDKDYDRYYNKTHGGFLNKNPPLFSSKVSIDLMLEYMKGAGCHVSINGVFDWNICVDHKRFALSIIEHGKELRPIVFEAMYKVSVLMAQ